MDKNTLGNYGWVVAVILVISIMISLASPFGSVISSNMKGALTGLKENQNDVLDNMGNASNFEDLCGGSQSNIGNGIVMNAQYPLVVDLTTELSWISAYLPAAMKNLDCEFTVSGTAGSTILSVSSATPLQMSEINSTAWWGGILTQNGIDGYEPYNVRYKSDTELEIFPALKTDVSNAILANYVLDAGTNYAGMHLTKRGYDAYAQCVYAANPKYAEKISYLARWRADVDSTSTTDIGPFVKYGGTANVGIGEKNINDEFMDSLARKRVNFGYVSGWGDSKAHETKTGLKWENVDLQQKTGYMELYIGGYVDGYVYPEGYEVNVDLYLDGELAYHYVKETTILERICVDFADADTATLDIYFNKMNVYNGASVGFTLSRCTFWENSGTFGTKLIQPNATIVQNFDSWGVYSDSASAKELERLHNVASRNTIPYVNNSKGSMTSTWSKENLYDNVLQYNTNYALFDFAINDTNSSDVTSELYRENMQWVFNECITNNIQPILIMPPMHGRYVQYVFDMIDATAVLSNQ